MQGRVAIETKATKNPQDQADPTNSNFPWRNDGRYPDGAIVEAVMIRGRDS